MKTYDNILKYADIYLNTETKEVYLILPHLKEATEWVG